MLVNLININKYYNGKHILKNINLRLESGKIYGFVGRNGSGKSILLKTICGFLKPNHGNVIINGVDIYKNGVFPKNTRALIDIPNYIPDLTGFENLSLLASIENIIGKEEIEQTLKLVNLYEEKDKKFKKYSLGMKQRLGIAATIMEDPDIIILDEPINALDDSGTEQVRQILMKHKQRGALIIIACHDADELEFLSDEIIEIAEGKIQPKKDKKSNKQ